MAGTYVMTIMDIRFMQRTQQASEMRAWKINFPSLPSWCLQLVSVKDSSAPLAHIDPMKASEIFSLAIRLAGLWLFATALPGLPSTISKLLTLIIELKLGPAFWLLISVVWTYAIAFWLLVGAPWIQQKAYPKSS